MRRSGYALRWTGRPLSLISPTHLFIHLVHLQIGVDFEESKPTSSYSLWGLVFIWGLALS